MAIAVNKSDNYEFEVVSLKEGNDLAKEINAIFKSTSAMLSYGIEDLFKLIREKFINPAFNTNEPSMNSKEEEFRKNIKIKNAKKGKPECKKCC